MTDIAPLPLSRNAALQRSLRAIGVGLHARLLFDQLPDLERASEALVWHITDRLPFAQPAWMGEPEPLIHVCLRMAFEATDAALDGGETNGVVITEIYLRGLLCVVDEVMHVAVTSRAEKLWKPTGNEPLSEWLRRNQGVIFTYIPPAQREKGASPSIIRTNLLSKICGPALLAALGRRVLPIVG